jgi:hypothetical protein
VTAFRASRERDWLFQKMGQSQKLLFAGTSFVWYNNTMEDNQQGSWKKKQSFISERVYAKRHYEKVELHCRVCNRVFSVVFHERNNRKTCGDTKCYKAWQSINQSKGVFRICPICGNRYKVAKSVDLKRTTCGNWVCTKKYRGQELGWIKIAPHLLMRKWVPEYRINSTDKEYMRVDFAKPEEKIAIEIDERNHNAAQTRARDKEKNNILEALGWKIFRVTEERILENLEEVVNEISLLNPSETTRN